MIRGTPSGQDNATAVAFFTGGKDSVTSFEVARYHHGDVYPVYLNLGTRQSVRNLEHATRYIYQQDYDVELEVFDVRDRFTGRFMNDDAEVDLSGTLAKHLGDENYESDGLGYLPLRTVVMVETISTFAERIGAEYVYFSFHGEEPLQDLDESDEAIEYGEMFVNECLPEGRSMTFVNALSGLMEPGVIRRGEEYNVPWELTCSCSDPGPNHCGECGSCLERARAFKRAGIEDPATYLTEPDV